MNMNRPDMTETVKSENYTNKFLQKDSNPVTMKASKSPAIGSSDQTKATSVSYTHLKGWSGSGCCVAIFYYQISNEP